MKKKYRNITVDNIEYAWMIKQDLLSVWKNKKLIIHEDVSYCIIKPSDVAEKIKSRT